MRTVLKSSQLLFTVCTHTMNNISVNCTMPRCPLCTYQNIKFSEEIGSISVHVTTYAALRVIAIDPLLVQRSNKVCRSHHCQLVLSQKNTTCFFVSFLMLSPTTNLWQWLQKIKWHIIQCWVNSFSALNTYLHFK